MPDVGTYREAGQLIDRLARSFEDAGMRAVSRSLAEVRRIAIEWSSSTLGADMRRQRPFARRHGEPLIDPGRVYVGNTGIFHQSWEIDEPTHDGDALVGYVFNSDPKAAAFLEPGTRFMFARPIDVRVMSEAEPIIDRIFDEEMDGFTGGG